MNSGLISFVICLTIHAAYIEAAPSQSQWWNDLKVKSSAQAKSIPNNEFIPQQNSNQVQKMPQFQEQKHNQVQVQVKPHLSFQELFPHLSVHPQPVMIEQVKPVVIQHAQPVLTEQVSPVVIQHAKPVMIEQVSPVVVEQAHPVQVVQNVAPYAIQQPVISATGELIIENTLGGVDFDCRFLPSGHWRDNNFCDVYHACVHGYHRKTYTCPIVGERTYFDELTQRCEFVNRNPNGCSVNRFVI